MREDLEGTGHLLGNTGGRRGVAGLGTGRVTARGCSPQGARDTRAPVSVGGKCRGQDVLRRRLEAG